MRRQYEIKICMQRKQLVGREMRKSGKHLEEQGLGQNIDTKIKER